MAVHLFNPNEFVEVIYSLKPIKILGFVAAHLDVLCVIQVQLERG